VLGTEGKMVGNITQEGGEVVEPSLPRRLQNRHNNTHTKPLIFFQFLIIYFSSLFHLFTVLEICGPPQNLFEEQGAELSNGYNPIVAASDTPSGAG